MRGESGKIGVFRANREGEGVYRGVSRPGREGRGVSLLSMCEGGILQGMMHVIASACFVAGCQTELRQALAVMSNEKYAGLPDIVSVLIWRWRPFIKMTDCGSPSSGYSCRCVREQRDSFRECKLHAVSVFLHQSLSPPTPPERPLRLRRLPPPPATTLPLPGAEGRSIERCGSERRP